MWCLMLCTNVSTPYTIQYSPVLESLVDYIVGEVYWDPSHEVPDDILFEGTWYRYLIVLCLRAQVQYTWYMAPVVVLCLKPMNAQHGSP